MKKIFMTMAAAALALSGCNNEMNEVAELAQPEVKFNISVDVEGQTRAVKSAWADGDKIYFVNSKYAAGDKYLTFNDGTWTPSSSFSAMTASSWESYYKETTYSAVWTSNPSAGKTNPATDSQVILSTSEANGQEVLVAKEGTEISFADYTWTIKLKMGQPAGFSKVTVEGLSDDNYRLQVTGASTTADMKYTNAFTLTTGTTSQEARNYEILGSAWNNSTGSASAAKGYLEGGNMCYFFKKTTSDDAASTTYFVLADKSVLTSATKIFCKKVEKAMPWATGKGVKIQAPVDLDMEVSTGWDAADANGWVRVK